MELTPGENTSEGRKSSLVVSLSLILPVMALIADLLLEQKVLSQNGTLALIAGLFSSAVASAGYSYSRATVKKAHAHADALKKKPVVLFSKEDSSGTKGGQ
jgi:hypothetical protein